MSLYGVAYGTTYRQRSRLNRRAGTQLQGGDVLAPHLYDWQLDGVDDYVDFGLFSGGSNLPFTFAIMFKPQTTDSNWHVPGISRGYTFVQWGLSNHIYAMYYRGRGAFVGWYVAQNLPSDQWYDVLIGADPSEKVKFSYLNGNLTASSTTTHGVTLWSYGTYIGRLDNGIFFGGKVAYAMLLIRKLSQTEIQQFYARRDLDTTDVFHLFDATFYEGGYYQDLKQGVNGTPYGIARVEAENKWIWYFKRLTTDGLIHLRFFPTGSTVRFSGPGSQQVDIPITSSDVALDPSEIPSVVNRVDLLQDGAIVISKSFGATMNPRRVLAPVR